jgi:hypothetical protein
MCLSSCCTEVAIGLIACRITGEMSRRITLLTYLYQFNMRNNYLSGTMPEDVFFLPRLAELDLSHNKFTGTLSESIGCVGLFRETRGQGGLGGCSVGQLSSSSVLAQMVRGGSAA